MLTMSPENSGIFNDVHAGHSPIAVPRLHDQLIDCEVFESLIQSLFFVFRQNLHIGDLRFRGATSAGIVQTDRSVVLLYQLVALVSIKVDVERYAQVLNCAWPGTNDGDEPKLKMSNEVQKSHLFL